MLKAGGAAQIAGGHLVGRFGLFFIIVLGRDHSDDGYRETVLRDGWHEQAGAFTQYPGLAGLDASNLMMPSVGFLPADDPRMLAHHRCDR